MRLKVPRGRYHLPSTLMSAHSSQWLLGGDNRLCTEGDKATLLGDRGEKEGHVGQLWAEELVFCMTGQYQM